MQIYDNDLRYKQIQNKMMNMPQWAKAEHMEMSVSEKSFGDIAGMLCALHKNTEGAEVCFSL